MNTITIPNASVQKIKSRGKVVGFFMPIEIWNTISEDLREDLEASLSTSYKRDIARARKSKKTYTMAEVEAMLAKK